MSFCSSLLRFVRSHRNSLITLSLLGLTLATEIVSAATVAKATVLKKTLVTSAQLGTNLSAVVDYSREWPFLNTFKVARTWISQQQGMPWGTGAPLHLTVDGYPASLQPGQYAETLIYDNGFGGNASYPVGRYTLLYDGDGTLQFDLQSASVVSRTPGRMLVDVPAGKTGVYLMITATNPRNPVQNIRMVTPGFEATYRTAPFNPTFLSRLKGYSALRFMEWMQTNTTTIKSWTDRPTLNDYTYTRRGVPLEVMIQLANQTGAAPWFNIPHMADDDYVKNFADMVKQQLNPNIPFYIEYSNETWNTQFSQAAYVRQKGMSLGLSADPTTAGAYYTSLRSVQIFNIFQKSFGSSDRFERVIASQAANPWLQDQTLSFGNAYQSTDALAIAPYFSDCSDASIGGYGPLGDPLTALQVTAMTVKQVISADQEHVQNCVLAEMNAAARVAANYRLQLVAYEGGQSLVGQGAAQSNTAMTALFGAANRDLGMGDLYSVYLNNWKSAGGALFMHFSDVTSYTAYGNFGSLERQDQDPATSPKYQALMRYAGQSQ